MISAKGIIQKSVQIISLACKVVSLMSNKKRFCFFQDPFHLGLKCVSLPGGLNESPGCNYITKCTEEEL